MASAQLAVLFVDVCDSTTLYESIGDARALAAISRLFGVLGGKVKARGGKVVKTLGDGMVCQFKDADGALAAACDMQAAATAAAAEAGAGPKLEIKVALNHGPVVTEQGDVFGDTVNVCARLAALAGPHQVLTTQETIDALTGPHGRSRPLHPLKIRGRVGEVKVCEVLWRLDEDSLVITKIFTKRQKAAPVRERILKVSYGGATAVVEPAGSIMLGRDKANDVVVASEKASRVHARIYGRDGNFVIADRSSNGTFVLVDGNSRELTLRRDEAMLGERGHIGLGGPAAGGGDHVLRYRLENRKP